MKVVLYTQTHFLDAVLETIQSLKYKFELFVLIEVSPESMQSTVVNLSSLQAFQTIETCDKLLGQGYWDKISPYFKGVNEVKFIVHHSPKSLSLESFKSASVVGKYIKKIVPDIVYFDSISTRSIGILPFIMDYPMFIAVHDPVPHSGEQSWKKLLLRKIYYPFANGFFFYSNFAKQQFEHYFSSYQQVKFQLYFQPFTIIKQLANIESCKHDYIFFFGRMSPYKGIDLLIEAIPLVLKSFPNEHFLLVGANDGYVPSSDILASIKDHITIDNRYQSTSDLALQIQNAKFIVCPYRDATQSGVLMTANALGKMVIASNVGAFPEYIEDEVNGLLMEPKAESIAKKIIYALTNNRFKEIESRVNAENAKKIQLYNEQCFVEAFENFSIL